MNDCYFGNTHDKDHFSVLSCIENTTSRSNNSELFQNCLTNFSCNSSLSSSQYPQSNIRSHLEQRVFIPHESDLCTLCRCSRSSLKGGLRVAWGKINEILSNSQRKQIKYGRHKDPLVNHLNLTHEMRTVLIDWMAEVCDAYKLHRETFYLAVDYVDRLLSLKASIQRSEFQCLGTTALFVAAKLEEIYPPKLSDFVYVTDGACSSGDILDMELMLLITLRWYLNPLTVIYYVRIYLQFLASTGSIISAETRQKSYSKTKTASPIPDKPSPPAASSQDLVLFSSQDFLHITQILDLCALDKEWLRFSYKELAVAAISHVLSKFHASVCSGMGFSEYRDCAQWMSSFATAASSADSNAKKCKAMPGIDKDNVPFIQCHDADISTLDKARSLSKECSRNTLTIPPIRTQFPTPPESFEPAIKNVPVKRHPDVKGEGLGYSPPCYIQGFSSEIHGKGEGSIPGLGSCSCSGCRYCGSCCCRMASPEDKWGPVLSFVSNENSSGLGQSLLQSSSVLTQKTNYSSSLLNMSDLDRNTVQ